MRFVLVGITLALLSSCATMFKSERQTVFIKGGPEHGVTKLLTPDGTFDLDGGQGSIILTRTKSDIPMKIVCPNGVTKQIVVDTHFDWLVAGLVNVLNYGIGWLIDPFAGESYNIDDNVMIGGQCPTVDTPVAH